MAPSSHKHADANDLEALASVFEERAEHLSSTELENWTAYTAKDEANITKLMGPGAKLLIGPRGSGKSTLLRTAYFRALASQETFAIYVNYSKSMALEPLFHKQANALQLFRQWLIAKIIVGAQTAFTETNLQVPVDLAQLAAYGRALIQRLETGFAPSNIDSSVSPSNLVELLESWTELLGRRRCVLLLDDAAHAFSPEQQREFFEVFRELRSRRVSGKAAVYPGITSYSPHFHVGHEAEILVAWYRPEEPDYLETMRSIVTRRLPPELNAKLSDRQELIDFLALAAFGLPRGFLNMLSRLLAVGEDGAAKPSRQRAEQAVVEHAESVRNIFRALSAKLPRFRHFIDVGRELEHAILRALQGYNKLKEAPSSKASVVALEEPISPQLERMLNMLEYAGLVRKLGTVSRGVKGRFLRYSIHHAAIISENALSLGKSYPLSTLIEALTSRDAHAFARTKGSMLLGENFEERCKLDLPPCKKCKTPRISEEQHFCMKCGTELTNASVYEELLRAPIDQLPLTQNKIDGIKKHTGIRTVQDVLLDDEAQEIRRIPYVGPFWAMRIRTVAEEFVSV